MTQAPSVTVTNDPAATPAPAADRTYPSADQVHQAIDTLNALTPKMTLALKTSWTNRDDVLQLDNGVAHHSTQAALRSRGLVEGDVALTNMGKLVRAMLLNGVAEVVKWAEEGRDAHIDQPDHELIGKRVHGFFARHELPTVQAIGTVVRAYLSHEMNGRRAEMITVACDDGTERTATRFSVSVLPDETASGPYAPSQVGADLPEQGGLWEVIDTREPFGSYYRVVRTSGGAPKYWTMFEDAAGHADELNRALAAESSIIQPEHELIGKRVRGTFSNGTDPDVEVTGTVTSAYLSGEIHGFRLPMFTVQCDDGRRRFMSQGSVTTIPDEAPAPSPTSESRTYCVVFGQDEALTGIIQPFAIEVTSEAELCTAVAQYVRDGFYDPADPITAESTEQAGDDVICGQVRFGDDKVVTTFTAADQRNGHMVGTEVVVYQDEPRHVIGTVLATYRSGNNLTQFVIVKCEDGETRHVHKADVEPLQAVKDMRLSVLLNAIAEPPVTMLDVAEGIAVGHAARVLHPNDTDATAPLTALVRLERMIEGGKFADDILGIVTAARDRLAELLTAYEQAHPMGDERLSEMDTVYRYVMILPGTFEREVLTVVKVNDDGTVNVRARGGSFFQAEPGQFAGRWPFGVEHAAV